MPGETPRWTSKTVILSAVVVGLSFCSVLDVLAVESRSKSIEVTSSAFVADAVIPVAHTGDGKDVSPALMWSGVPEGTKELALIVDDPDAPTPQPWVHWVMYKIPPSETGLPKGIATSPKLENPKDALQGKNSWGTIGYRGPAPPPGHGVHHYHFKLYALDTELSAEAGLDKQALLKLIEGHVLAEGELTGTYSR